MEIVGLTGGIGSGKTTIAKMFEEHTGYSVDDLVIAMVAEDGQVELFKSKTELHLQRLEEILDEFYDSVFDELAA